MKRYNNVLFNMLVENVNNIPRKVLTEDVTQDKTIFVITVAKMMNSEKFKTLINEISDNTKVSTEIIQEDIIIHIVSNFKDSVIFNEAFVSQPVDKIVDGFIKEFNVTHAITDYIWFVLADWLRFNTIGSKTKNHKKELGKYFLGMQDFSKAVSTKITKNKQRMLSEYKNGKVKYQKYLTEKSKAYVEFLDKNNGVKPVFDKIKSHIEALHNFQSTKVQSHPTMYVPQEVIDKRRVNDKTAVDSSHTDDVYGIPFGYIQKENITPEVVLSNVMGKIKILTSAIQKALGSDNLMTSKNDTVVEGAIAWGFDSAVCYFIKKIYDNINGTQYDSSSVISYFVERLINTDVMTTQLYLDFLHVYGTSLDKNNLDFLDYDEVMKWEDTFLGKDSKGKVKLSPNQISDIKFEEDKIQIIDGKKVTSFILYDELKDLENQLQDKIGSGTDSEINAIGYKITRKTNEMKKFVKKSNNIKIEDLKFNIQNLYKMLQFNIKLYKEYLSKYATKQVIEDNKLPLEGKTEEWVSYHLPKQLVAYRVSHTAYLDAIDFLKKQLQLQVERMHGKPFAYLSNEEKVAKISEEEFKKLFGENTLSEVDISDETTKS